MSTVRKMKAVEETHLQAGLGRTQGNEVLTSLKNPFKNPRSENCRRPRFPQAPLRATGLLTALEPPNCHLVVHITKDTRTALPLQF